MPGSRPDVGGVTTLHPAREQLFVRAIDLLRGWNLQGDVVEARGVALAERQDVVVRPIGAKEHLATELVDAFKPPAGVVERGLIAQTFGLQANVREPGYVH